MSVKAIDLFSGCGGVSCGLTNAGFTMKAAVEIEKTAVDIYKKYKPLSKVKVLDEDITGVEGKRLLKEARIDLNELYLLAGCPPCQNFSMINRKGRKKSAKERKKLLFQYLRIIEELHPPFVLLENVPGIKTSRNAKILNEFFKRLKNEGAPDNQRYYIDAHGILNAANYGVPQLRRRFVMHAVRYDIYKELQVLDFEFKLPAPTHNKNGEKGLKKWVTVKEALEDLPKIKAGETYPDNDKIKNHKCAGLSEINLNRMRAIRKNGGSRTGLPPDMVLECHKKLNKEGKVFGGHKDVYGIMDGNKPSPTMTGGCLCYSKGRYGHYEQDRAISIREAARLQTFPDDFEFSNTLGESALQIGNAVPIKLVEASGAEILKAIKLLLKARRRK